MKMTVAIRTPDTEVSGAAGTPRRPLPGLSLVYHPNPVLRATCQPVDRYDTELRDLAQEMHSLMRLNAGIGLAGPQVSVKRRLLVCEIEGRQLRLTNPQILTASEPGEFVEGCLSLPGVQISVTRPERIQVTGYDLRGRRIRFDATGLWARVIQHEMDHLDGVLIYDRGRPPAQPCGPCSQALPALLIEERRRQSRPNR